MKKAKIDLLYSQRENFSMDENESIDDIITCFTKITNGLSSLGDTIDNDQKIRKVIRALPPSWEVKSTFLKELSVKEKMDFVDPIGNLKAHEMERKAREEKAPQKEKKSCIQGNSYFLRDDEENEQEDDEELSLLVKSLRRLYTKEVGSTIEKEDGKERRKEEEMI